jgi:hypothetical protein
MALEGKAKSLTNYEMTDWQKYHLSMLPANSLNVKTCLVQSDSPARSAGDRAAPLSERNARSADPGRRDADRVEQALAGDRELARHYELVRQELAETTRLNETLGAPSARAMEKLFAAINAEEARAPRQRRRPINRTRFLNSARDRAADR